MDPKLGKFINSNRLQCNISIQGVLLPSKIHQKHPLDILNHNVAKSFEKPSKDTEVLPIFVTCMMLVCN